MAEISPIHGRVMDALRHVVSEDVNLELPPPVASTLGMQFVEYAPGKRMTCLFPTPDTLTNPMGAIQGGILTAAFDAVFGCLAMLSARRPCVSLTIDTAFIRPIFADHGEFIIEAKLRARTRTHVFLEGKALTFEKKTAATATTTMTAYRAPSH